MDPRSRLTPNPAAPHTPASPPPTPKRDARTTSPTSTPPPVPPAVPNAASAPATTAADTAPITLTVNGRQHTLPLAPMTRLLDLLREHLRLTGTKEGCGEGECGACAVLLDGELVNSCLVPALQASNSCITTIEGLALPPSSSADSPASPTPVPAPGTLAHLAPIQRCFLEAGGAQCGICTPGMILATHHLLQKHPQPTPAQITEGLAGNLCRCTGYTRILEAVHLAAAAKHVQPKT